jgi:hypothetical protein
MNYWEQAKDKTRAIQIKMRMVILENSIESNFLRLGTRLYDLRKGDRQLAEDPEIQALLREVAAKKNELAGLKEEFRRYWGEEAKELKASLEKGGGALEQISIAAHSRAIGRKIKELDLPKEVLLGPVLRDHELIIPDGETELLKGDRITLMGKQKDVQATVKLFKEHLEISKDNL